MEKRTIGLFLTEETRDLGGRVEDFLSAHGEKFQVLKENSDVDWILCDEAIPNVNAQLSDWKTQEKVVFLLTRDKAIPGPYDEGLVDDFLHLPLNEVEFIPKLNHFKHIFALEKLIGTNAQLSDLLEGFQSDVQALKKIHKKLMPSRFPKIDGVELQSRYRAGDGGGSDFVDVLASKNDLFFLYTHSSSFGLSSQVLPVLFQLALRIAKERDVRLLELVSILEEQIRFFLNEESLLDFIILKLDRGSLEGEYVGTGGHQAFILREKGAREMLDCPFESIGESEPFPKEISSFSLGLKDQLLFLSRGIVEEAENINAQVMQSQENKSVSGWVQELGFITEEKGREKRIDQSIFALEVVNARPHLAKREKKA